eukprot:13281316-Alexandrium_andersonii.AAC.1
MPLSLDVVVVVMFQTCLPALTPNSKRLELELPNMQNCFRPLELNCAGPGTASTLLPEAPEAY